MAAKRKSARSGSRASAGRRGKGSRAFGKDVAFLPDMINRVTRHLNEVTLEDLRRFGMTVPRWSVLSQLAVRDGRSIGELSRATVIKQSSLTRVVDQMERDDLVSRYAAEEDSRIVEVWLTEAGRAMYDRVVPLAVQRTHQVLEGLREAEVELLSSLLERLLANVRGDRKRL